MPLEDPDDLAMMSLTPAISRMRARRSAGDDAGAGRGRLHQHSPGARGGAEDRVDDGRTGEGHVEEVLASLFDALLHRESGLLGLAVAETNPALAVTDHHEGGEGEPAATLGDLRDAIHLDGALFELFDVNHIKLQSGGAKGVGERRHPAVIIESAAVEDHGGDVGGLGSRDARSSATALAPGDVAAAGLLF